MAFDYTTDALIADVKRRITIPTSQDLYPDSDLLEVLTREMHMSVASLYVSLREDFFRTYVDLPCSAGVTSFAIPASRAVGNKLVDVNYIPSGGGISKLVLVDASQINISGGYWIENNRINIPSAFTVGSIRCSYLRKPAFLATTDECAKVTGINTGTNTVTCETVPSTWTTSTVLDTIQGLPPFNALADDQTPVAVTPGTPGTIQFSTLPSGLVVGDWIAPQFMSPIPQVPPESHNLIAVCAGIQILQSLGSLQEIQPLMAERARLERAVSIMSAPRVEQDQRRFINKPFQGVVRRYGTWGY